MKKAEITFPITEESFDQAWTYVEENRRRAICRKYVREISSAVGNLAYFLLMCLLMFGCLRQLEGVHLQAFLQTIPVLPEIWEQSSTLLFDPIGNPWAKLAVALAGVWLVPLVLAALCSGLVRLCCRPKKLDTPEGAVRENATVLRKEAHQLVRERKCRHIRNSAWYMVLFCMAFFAVLLGFYIYLTATDNSEVLSQVLAVMQYLLPMLILLMAVYSLGYMPVLHLMRLLYIQKLPKDLEEQVNDYWLRVNPEEQARLEEEDRILALAEEIRRRRIQEHDELYGSKKNQRGKKDKNG